MPVGPTIEKIGAQTNTEMVARWAELNGGIAAPDFINQSPEISGDFSLPPLDQFLGLQPVDELPTDSPAFTTIADHLPSIASQVELLGNLQQSELLGEMMQRARLSKLTGCIMRPHEYRNHNLYSWVKSEAAKEIGLGSYRQAHRVAHFLHSTELSGQPPTHDELKMTVDHICRNPSCCNPEHTRLLSGADNNDLKNRANKIEPDIIRGQMFYLQDLFEQLPWLEHTFVHSDLEIPDRAISTRVGPFALRVASPNEALVYGQKLYCEVYDSLRTPGQNKYRAPSRAKAFMPIKDNKDLFHKNKFKKKTVPSQKDLYEQSMQAA